MIKPEGRGFNSHPGKSFSLSLCGLHSISRADAHMVPVYMGRKLALHITLYRVICSTTSATLPTFAKKLPFLVLENNIHLCTNGIKLARVNDVNTVMNSLDPTQFISLPRIWHELELKGTCACAKKTPRQQYLWTWRQSVVPNDFGP